MTMIAVGTWGAMQWRVTDGCTNFVYFSFSTLKNANWRWL